MKKTYVSPVMETEEFAANEYVAGCWEVYCVKWAESYTTHDHVDKQKVTADNMGDAIMSLANQYGISYSGYAYSHVTNFVAGRDNVEVPCAVYADEVKDAAHPNASV